MTTNSREKNCVLSKNTFWFRQPFKTLLGVSSRAITGVEMQYESTLIPFPIRWFFNLNTGPSFFSKARVSSLFLFHLIGRYTTEWHSSIIRNSRTNSTPSRFWRFDIWKSVGTLGPHLWLHKSHSSSWSFGTLVCHYARKHTSTALGNNICHKSIFYGCLFWKL